MNYSPKDLSYIATIIKAAAAARDWSLDLASGNAEKVEEVQCMQIDGDDKVYIACNCKEDQKVRNYLSSFDTDTQATFEDCLRISHWFLSLTHGTLTKHNANRSPDQPKVKFASEYLIEYSEQDLKVINGFTKPKFLAIDSSLESKIYTSLYDGGGHGWFVRKFAHVNDLTNAAKPKGQPRALLSTFSNAKSVNVLSNEQEGLHAELVLLSFLASEIVANPEHYANKVVHLGGAKKACKHCSAWIALYKCWMLNRYRVTLKTPDADGKDERSQGKDASNATRPTNETLKTLGGAPALLFTGDKGGNGSELNAMSEDKELWLR